MYVPASFAISDEKTLGSFIERYDFATLTSSSSTGLVASHIRIMLRRSAGKAVLVGHVARANDQWRQFDGNAEALAIFHGPHAYVSPTWYGDLARRPYVELRGRSRLWEATCKRRGPLHSCRSSRPCCETRRLSG